MPVVKVHINYNPAKGDLCMKKKLLLTVLALVCAVTCAFGLAACNEEGSDKVSCTLAPTPEHILQVQLLNGNSTVADLGAYCDRWETPRQIDKNIEVEIHVYLDYEYEIGTLKMSVNDTETALTPYIDPNTNQVVSGSYFCKYTPTADFTITFGGKAQYVPTIAVTGITLNKTVLNLTVGGEETLQATVTPANATNKTVTWSSDTTTVATVNNSGKVVAVAQGTAVIYATAGNESSACTVTVNAPTTTTEVTAGQWTEILTNAQSSLNFIMTLKDKDVNYDVPDVNGDIHYPMTIEIDELKGHYLDGMTLNVKTECVYVKDGENYYDYEGKGNVWTRKVISSSEYQSQYGSFQSMAGMLTLPFANDFTSFRYENGKYVCDALNKPDMQASFVNIEITFENGAVKSVTLEQEGDHGGLYQIHFGTTTITLPTNYTESNN